MFSKHLYHFALSNEVSQDSDQPAIMDPPSEDTEITDNLPVEETLTEAVEEIPQNPVQQDEAVTEEAISENIESTVINDFDPSSLPPVITGYDIFVQEYRFFRHDNFDNFL